MARNFSGQKVLVMGLGHFGGGAGVSRYLTSKGAKVTVSDMADAEKLTTTISTLDGYDVDLHLGGHTEEDFINNNLIVVNPAVKPESPWRKVAQDHGNELTSEMNLFFESCPCPIIGITGSNGKSTTSTMLAHILEQCKDKTTQYNNVYLGGNIGQDNLLESLSEITKDDICVIELSSFQLKSLGEIKKSPHIAIITNVAPNHLDWHGTLEDYVTCKQNILRFQTENDHAVLCLESHVLKGWAALSTGHLHFYRCNSTNKIALKTPGHHNQTNAQGAITAASLLGIDPTDSIYALKQYQGLPHRIEFVKEVNNVKYYNDSIATTPESTIAAIASFKKTKTLIIGGYDKGVSYEGLIDYIDVTQRAQLGVNNVILIGQVKDKLYKQITDRNMTHCSCHKVNTLADAVETAYKAAQEDDVVLLSPASASYDMFKNFADRGEQFKQLVNAL